jgi:hypothetical protein
VVIYWLLVVLTNLSMNQSLNGSCSLAVETLLSSYKNKNFAFTQIKMGHI